MVGMLLAEWDEHLGRVQKALLDKDSHELRMHAHTLKSLLAMFHAEIARRRAMEIEQAAISMNNVDWERCHEIFAQLVGEMKQIRPTLQKFVETRVIP